MYSFDTVVTKIIAMTFVIYRMHKHDLPCNNCHQITYNLHLQFLCTFIN